MLSIDWYVLSGLKCVVYFGYMVMFEKKLSVKDAIEKYPMMSTNIEVPKGTYVDNHALCVMPQGD